MKVQQEAKDIKAAVTKAEKTAGNEEVLGDLKERQRRIMGEV